MPRKPKFGVPTIAKRIPAYALDQVEHFTQLLVQGGELRVVASIPGSDGTSQRVEVIYTQNGYLVLSSEGVEQANRETGATATADDGESKAVALAEEDVHFAAVQDENPEPDEATEGAEPVSLPQPLQPEPEILKQFVLSVFEGWQALTAGAWGTPVLIEHLYDRQFRSRMLVLNFLSQLGAAADQGIGIPQGRLVLHVQEQNVSLLQIGSQTANAITFTRAIPLRRSRPQSSQQQSQPIVPLQVRPVDQFPVKLKPGTATQQGKENAAELRGEACPDVSVLGTTSGLMKLRHLKQKLTGKK